jgi:hypothetical protein
MTYCDQPWPSGYTIRALRKSIECESELIRPPSCDFDDPEFIRYALLYDPPRCSLPPLSLAPQALAAPPAFVAEIFQSTPFLDMRLEARQRKIRSALPLGATALGFSKEGSEGLPTSQVTETRAIGGVSVVAIVDAPKKKAQIVSVKRLATPPAYQATPASSGEIRIVVRNKDGEVEFSAVATLRAKPEQAVSASGIVAADLPISDDSEFVEVVIDEVAAERRKLEGAFSDFTLSVERPLVNHHAGPSDAPKTITFSWQLAPEDAGKEITFGLEQWDGEAKAWQTLVTDLRAGRITLPAPAGDSGSRYRVTATSAKYSIIKTITLPPGF